VNAEPRKRIGVEGDRFERHIEHFRGALQRN
jgi:hypothetical protein